MGNIFSDDPMFKLSEERTIGPTPPMQPDEIARGDGWYVRRVGGTLELHYMAGEQGGRAKHILISLDEAMRLAAEKVTVDELLIAHGI